MELQLSWVLLSLLIYQFTTTTTSKPHGLPPAQLNSLSYTTIQFVQTWAPGYCKKKGRTCISNRESKFYIHGLWPANSHGDSLRNCKRLNKPLTETYLNSEIKDIKTKLDEDWPTLIQGSSNLAFWVNEWHWHGVCSKLTILDPKSYFQKGLDAKGKADLLTILDKVGIQPGPNTYSQYEIQKAVRDDLGIGIYITCVEKGGKIYLNEIYLCMDVHAEKFIHCPAKRSHRDCGNFQQPTILFPQS